MAGNSARRARRAAIEAGELPEEPEDDPELEALKAASRDHGAALGQRFVNWINQGNQERESAMRMSGNDVPIALVGTVALAIISLVLIVGREQWKGSHPSPVWLGVGCVLALVGTLSVRLQNRVVTPIPTVLSVLAVSAGENAVPHSYRGLVTVAFAAGLLVTAWLMLRQSRARGVEAATRRAGQRAARGDRARGSARTAKKAEAEDEPAVPKSARYTPPKKR